MGAGLSIYQWNKDRVARLEQAASQAASYTQPNYSWNFRAAVSCPPSTTIHMRGGRVWGDPSIWDGISWYVEPASYDLADAADTGYSYTFTNAYYYKALSIMLRYSGHPPSMGANPPIYVLASPEQATAALAEEAAYPKIVTGAFDPDISFGISLGIFIVRNNGNTASPNQFQPIDRVNRDRSYMFRDLKLRFQW